MLLCCYRINSLKNIIFNQQSHRFAYTTPPKSATAKENHSKSSSGSKIESNVTYNTLDVFNESAPQFHENKSIKREEIIIVVGEEGSGKRTFIKIMTIDNRNLNCKNINLKECRIEEIVNESESSSDGERNESDEDESKPIIPLCFSNDATNGPVYCDFPSLGDSNDVAKDINTKFFTKEFFKRVQSVKFVILATTEMIMSDAIKKLLVKVSNMIKDVDKFQQSIVLVVNKFENVEEVQNEGNDSDEDGIRVRLTDSQSKQKIIARLRELRTAMKNEEKAAALLDIFLNKLALPNPPTAKSHENKVEWPFYPRICLLRKPIITKRQGMSLLSDIEPIQNDKKRLKAVVEDTRNCPFVRVAQNHFDSTLSKNSRKILDELIKDIVKHLTKDFKPIGEAIEEHFKTLEGDIGIEIDFLDDRMSDMSEQLKKMEPMDAPLFLDEILKLAATISINNLTISKRTKEVKLIFSFLDFLKSFSENPSTATRFAQNSLTECQKYITESKRWYKALNEIKEKLSSEDVRKRKKKCTSDFLNEILKAHDFHMKDAHLLNDIVFAARFDKKKQAEKDDCVNKAKMYRLKMLLAQLLGQ